MESYSLNCAVGKFRESPNFSMGQETNEEPANTNCRQLFYPIWVLSVQCVRRAV